MGVRSIKTKTFRITLSIEEHSDVIRAIERCPKPLRNELIVFAIRFLEENKQAVFMGGEVTVASSAKKSDEVTSQKPGTQKGIDFTDIF